MDMLKKKMIREAVLMNGEIFPTNSEETFENCFSIVDNHYVFWFNNFNNSTKIISEEIPSWLLITLKKREYPDNGLYINN